MGAPGDPPARKEGASPRRAPGLDEPGDIVVRLLDELADLYSLDIANLVLVADDRAVVTAAREHGEDNERILGREIPLKREASGVSTVLREGNAFAVYDAEAS